MRQTLKMREDAGAVDGDNNGFVNIPLAAREVLAAVYMREVGRRTSIASACVQRATSMSQRSPKNLAAAATKMRPDSRSKATGTKRKEIVEAVRDAIERCGSHRDWRYYVLLTFFKIRISAAICIVQGRAFCQTVRESKKSVTNGVAKIIAKTPKAC